jgi:tetratricopeptide (TPR) repeat protein
MWPPALLLLFVAAFRTPDAGDRFGDNRAARVRGDSLAAAAALAHTRQVGSAARAVDQCEKPRLDVAALEQCLLVQPGDVELMLDLGASYEAAGRCSDAYAVYRRATRVDPRDGEAHRRLGRGYLAHGDLAAARREGAAAQVTQPGNLEVLSLAEADAGSEEP